jgi:NADH-ubiquinone oxidoreductase chain 5
MLRSSPIIEYGPTVLVVITWVGALTAFFAATTGLLQNDLKRVIAYSTCSQIGYLFMAVGLSQYNVALFHLVNHRFFKALLFLAAGAVIHGMADQQDLRRLGGLVNFLPFTYTAILVGSLSLMAFPFLTGFYSKDLILEVALGQYEVSGNVAYWLGTISAVFTAFYSFRLISLTFFTEPNAPKGDYLHAHEAPMIIVIPLVILSVMSIAFGYVAKDLFVGPGSDFLSTALFQHPNHISLIEAEFGLPLVLKLLPAVGSLFGAGLAVYLYHTDAAFNYSLTNNFIGKALYKFLNGKWLFDIVYNNYIINGGLRLGHVISKVIDRGVIEMVGPYGFSTVLTNTSRTVASYDTGIITSYALYIILGLISFIFLLFAPVLLQDNGIDSVFGGDLGLILVYLSALLVLPTTKNASISN